MSFLKVAADVINTGGILDTSAVLDVRQVLNTSRVLGGVGELLDRSKPKEVNDLAEDDNQDFITLSNSDATNDKEKREQKNALRVIGNRYLQYLAALDPNSTEAQALLSHSGFNSMTTLITTFKNGSGGTRLTLKFSTHEKNSDHESAGDGQFYTHPDGYGDITGIGAMYLSNVITISKDIYYLYKYMASREYINIKLDGQPFDYDLDISKAFDFISQILEHETCHWGADLNGPRVRPPEFFDDNNTTELLINGIQQGDKDNTWELGQHFEWAAWGRLDPVYNRSDSVELRYGAAVNIHYKLMGTYPCELNIDNNGNTIKPSTAQIQQIKTSLDILLANYYPQNLRVKPNGEKDGGYNSSPSNTDIAAGYH